MSTTAIFSDSGKIVPTLAQMIRDARTDQVVIKRATQADFARMVSAERTVEHRAPAIQTARATVHRFRAPHRHQRSDLSLSTGAFASVSPEDHRQVCG
jgi:hypothetical protein